MTIIKWAPRNHEDSAVRNSLDLAYLDVEPVLPYIIKSREHEHGNTYLKCPAFLDYYKNTYVVRSPISTKLTADADTKFLRMHTHNQEFYDKFITNRTDAVGRKDPFLTSIGIYYLFVADTECMVEQLPAHFHDNQIKNIRVIPGTFDVSKWFRPMDFAFEILDVSKPVEINRGDAMYYVRFVPKDGGKVVLQKTKFTDAQLKAVDKCINLKIALAKQPLKILYELAEPLKKLFKKKCPFDWRAK